MPAEEIDDALQMLAAVEVPVDNAYRTGRPHHQAQRREVAGDDFLHGHIYISVR